MFGSKKVETKEEAVKVVPHYILDCGCGITLNFNVSYYTNSFHPLYIENKSRLNLKCQAHKREVIMNAFEKFNKLEDHIKKSYIANFILELYKGTGISLCEIETLIQEQAPQPASKPQEGENI